jgi:hypothetical protein
LFKGDHIFPAHELLDEPLTEDPQALGLLSSLSCLVPVLNMKHLVSHLPDGIQYLMHSFPFIDIFGFAA